VMGRYDDPTRQVPKAPPPPARLPGSLDPLRGHPAAATEVETGTGWVDTDRTAEIETPLATPPVAQPAEPTGVLRLDEIFDDPGRATPARESTPIRESTAAAEAPTWTAMPVVPVRSEPIAAAPAGAIPSRSSDDRTETAPRRSSWDGAEVAWLATRDRVESWLRRDDNGLMLLTAVVACVLMIVVAGVGR